MRDISPKGPPNCNPLEEGEGKGGMEERKRGMEEWRNGGMEEGRRGGRIKVGTPGPGQPNHVNFKLP